MPGIKEYKTFIKNAPGNRAAREEGQKKQSAGKKWVELFYPVKGQWGIA